MLTLCKRLTELVGTGDSIAVLEQGLSFGGGALQNFGINSNTSANGFIKGLYKKVAQPNTQPWVANTTGSGKLKDMTAGLDEVMEEDDDSEEQDKDTAAEYVAL